MAPSRSHRNPHEQERKKVRRSNNIPKRTISIPKLNLVAKNEK
jgi:hypothetical protein